MPAPVRILVVEDEFLTANAIREALQSTGYTISGIAKNAREALSILKEDKTDLVMLDINIQGPDNGIWLANQMNQHYRLPFIYLTAFSDRLTVDTAIETQPFGYLVKPFSPRDIYTAIEIALRNFLRMQGNEHPQVDTSADDTSKGPLLIEDYVFIKEQHLFSKVRIAEILFVKAEKKNVLLKTKSKDYLPRHTFSEFAGCLPSDHFIQVHRSYMVNKACVDHLGPNFLIVAGNEIPISTQRKEEVYKAFRFV